MQLLQNISLEYRIGLIFGGTALLFTLFIGIISGVRFDVIAIRLIIMAPVYTLIGAGIIMIIKKFVPEFYEVLNRSSGRENSDTEIPGGRSADIEGGSFSDESQDESVADGGEFSEMDTDEFPRLKTDETPDLENPLDNSPNVTGGKLGRHIVATEKVAKYEPKVMAEAVRTMMSKDED